MANTFRIYRVTIFNGDSSFSTDFRNYRDAGRAFRQARKADKWVTATTWLADDVGALARFDQTDQTPMWALDPKFHY
jgi:hypothetical protein